MNFDDKYYHGLGECSKYNYKDIILELKTLELILKSKAILAKSLQYTQKSDNRVGFNGMNYISLCKGVMGRNIHYSAYKMFIEASISLILDSKLPNIIKPTVLSKHANQYSLATLKFYSKDDNRERYTDFQDEVQVKYKIDLSNVVAIGFPLDFYFAKAKNKINIAEGYLNLKELLKKYKYNWPIYDINNEVPLNDELVLTKIVKYQKGK